MSTLPAFAQRTYTVEKDDTLFGIARRELGNGARWQELAERNDIRAPYVLNVGQEIVLRDSDAETAERDQAEKRRVPAQPNLPDAKSAAAEVEVSKNQTASKDQTTSLKPEFVPNEPVNISLLLNQAFQMAPRIERQKALIAAAQARVGYVGALPDPQLMGMLQNVGVDGITVGDRNALMAMVGGEIQQRFPSKRKRTAEEQIAEAEVLEKQAQLTSVTASVMADVRRHVIDLYRIDEQARELMIMRENYRSLEKSLTTRYAVGLSAQSDILRVQAEITRITQQLSRLKAERTGVAAEISALTGVPIGEIGTVSDLHWAHSIEIPFHNGDYTVSFDWLNRSPRVLEAAARREISSAKIKRAEAESGLDWSLSGGVFYRGQHDPIVRVGVGVSLPVRGGSRQVPMLEEAGAARAATDAELEDARLDIRRRWEGLAEAHRQGEFQVGLIENTLLPQARLAFESTLSRFRVGEAPFESVIQALLTLERIQLDFITLKAHHARHVVQFAEIFGITEATGESNHHTDLTMEEE